MRNRASESRLPFQALVAGVRLNVGVPATPPPSTPGCNEDAGNAHSCGTRRCPQRRRYVRPRTGSVSRHGGQDVRRSRSRAPPASVVLGSDAEVTVDRARQRVGGSVGGGETDRWFVRLGPERARCPFSWVGGGVLAARGHCASSMLGEGRCFGPWVHVWSSPCWHGPLLESRREPVGDQDGAWRRAAPLGSRSPHGG